MYKTFHILSPPFRRVADEATTIRRSRIYFKIAEKKVLDKDKIWYIEHMNPVVNFGYNSCGIVKIT